jgi:uncharacterized protein
LDGIVVRNPDVSAPLPALPEVAIACRTLQLGIDASELHGGLCGWLAGGGAASPEWLRRVLVDEGLPLPGEGDVLDRLRSATVAQFEDREFGFELLLPVDEASLEARSGALFDWCRGFVGAFGLAAGAAPPLSEDGAEALADLAELARASAEAGGDEEDEQAFAEIEEFVRVAVLLLHGDCALGPRHRGRLN